MTTISFELNRKAVTINAADPEMPLLYALRGELAQRGPKFGCGLAQCGACTIIMNGQATRSCVTPVRAAAMTRVETLDGLARGGTLHRVQAAFVAEQALQCGYCTNGMIMSAKALLDRTPKPSDAQIIEALDGHLCRCGTYSRIVAAVHRAAASTI